jgi:protein TonB
VKKTLPILPLVALLAGCATGPQPYVPEFAEPFELLPGQQVDPPEVIEREVPTYPEELRRARIEGEVVVRGAVGRDGVLHDVEVVRADDEALVGAVLSALRAWRFRPATVDGQPVAVYYTVTHGFWISR